MKKYRKHIIIGIAVAAVLALVFWWGGNAPGLRGWNVQEGHTAAPSAQATPEPEQSHEPPAPDAAGESAAPPSAEATNAATSENRPGGAGGRSLTAEEKLRLAAQLAGDSAADSSAHGGGTEQAQQTAPPPEMLPEKAAVTAEGDEEALTCTLSVRCDEINSHMAWLVPEKRELIPSDGVILPPTEVTFYEGESVFHLLQREMKKNRIHLEFTNTPIYNSAYIEGIYNLYEFDCGELSGWIYRVNGVSPGYGCSLYKLKAGDRVEWFYTCDMKDGVRNFYSAPETE